MAIIETAHKWAVFTSTGTGKFLALGPSQSLTFGIETSTGCTATVQIVHRMGSTLGANSVLSTVNSTLGVLMTDQFLGPLEYVAPRVTDKTSGSTATVTVFLRAV